MSFDKVSCVIVTCDLCDVEFISEDYLVHYDNEDEAREVLGDCGWGWDALNVWCDGCNAHCACGCAFHFHDEDNGSCEECDDCGGWQLSKNWS